MLIQLFCLFFAVGVHATVFQMQPVTQQIKESDGIVIGHYLKSRPVHLDDGTLATQMIFKVNKEFGIQSELFGMDEVIIHYPGGQMGEQVVKVEGVPAFIPGEHVVLMIRSHEDRYWGMNLGFGTFKVVNYGNEPMIVNTLFPEDRRVGQIKLEDFEKSVRNIKGSHMKVVRSQQYPSEQDPSQSNRAPASVSEGKNRAIASDTEGMDNEEDRPGFSTFWLVAFLAVLGGVFKLMQKKESR